MKNQYQANDYKCKKCGCSELDYEKWINCRLPVSEQNDGHIEYGSSQIDEENELVALSGFVCRDCGHRLSYRGCNIETERELLDYLSIDKEIREENEKLYEQCLAELAHDEEIEEELIEYAAEAADSLTD